MGLQQKRRHATENCFLFLMTRQPTPIFQAKMKFSWHAADLTLHVHCTRFAGTCHRCDRRLRQQQGCPDGRIKGTIAESRMRASSIECRLPVRDIVQNQEPECPSARKSPFC
jgi:hypothetical protein